MQKELDELEELKKRKAALLSNPNPPPSSPATVRSRSNFTKPRGGGSALGSGDSSDDAEARFKHF